MNMRNSIKTLNKVVSNAIKLMHDNLASYLKDNGNELFCDYQWDVEPMFAYIIDGNDIVEKHIKAIKIDDEGLLIYVDDFDNVYEEGQEIDWENNLSKKVYALNNPFQYLEGLNYHLTNISVLTAIEEYLSNE